MTTDRESNRKLRRATVFAPLVVGGRVESVGQRIASAVHLGLLTDGEQFPAEAELATQLNVSTVTLREALAHLRVQGVIETRRGRNGGSFIRSRGGAPASVLRARLLQMSSAEWRDLGDELAAIETDCAHLAAQRATPEDLDNLRRMLELLPGASTVAERYRADSRFHLAIAIASQSERLTRSELRLQ